MAELRRHRSTAMSTGWPPVIAIAGPTCTGKTRVAIELALEIGAELINADSRQVRRGLVVGTCAPTAEDLRGLRLHLSGVVDPGVPYTVADWMGEARRLLVELAAAQTPAVVVGGTGLYIRALLEGYTLGGAGDPGRRHRGETAAALAAELAQRAPERAADVDLSNPRRVLRALEQLDIGAEPGQLAAHPAQGALRFGLDTDRSLHRRWIEERTAHMWSSGELLAETAAALDRGFSGAGLDGCGIGYREAVAVLHGDLTPSAAAALALRRTLRYARQQRTFFRADPRMRWLEAARPAARVTAEISREAVAAAGQGTNVCNNA